MSATKMMPSRIEPCIAEIINAYPRPIRDRVMRLRELIYTVAAAEQEITAIEETLKWGEPSYLTKGGSTVRLGWKAKNPGQVALYFHCQTSLVETFKELYGNTFNYEGNRAILFDIEGEIPVKELKHCILLSLTYHSRKHLDLLGA